MLIHGDLYYEGKEFETKLKNKKPGELSEELRVALGMPIGPVSGVLVYCCLFVCLKWSIEQSISLFVCLRDFTTAKHTCAESTMGVLNTGVTCLNTYVYFQMVFNTTTLLTVDTTLIHSSCLSPRSCVYHIPNTL